MRFSPITKKIKALSEDIYVDWEKPSPSSKEIPDWFKKIQSIDDEHHDMTIKKCIPVLDTLTIGYVFKTSADVIYDDKYKRFLDNGVSDVVTHHPSFQIENMEIDSNLDPIPFKWINKSIISI